LRHSGKCLLAASIRLLALRDILRRRANVVADVDFVSGYTLLSACCYVGAGTAVRLAGTVTG